MLKNVETRVGLFVLMAIGVFAYMGFQIGAFRFDRYKYNTFQLYFKDVGGLVRKAQVKIAGVTVGWVEKVDLPVANETIAVATIMVHNNYSLYQNAYAIVRQDGLLGPKYIELIPGDSSLPKLQSGALLQRPSVETASFDELMITCKTIAGNVLDITESFKDAVSGQNGMNQIGDMISNLSHTAEKCALFSDMIESSIAKNTESIEDLFSLGTNVKNITQILQSDVLPSFQTSIEKISEVFDRDFDRIANSLSATADTLTDTVTQAKEGFSLVSSVAQKVDEGKGLLGKLINEDETYSDLRVAIQGFKNYVAKMDRLEIVFDSHFESMHRVAENYEHEDSKGYFDVRIHPNEDHFYMVQFATSEKGTVRRKEFLRSYLDDSLQKIDTSKIPISGFGLLEEVFRKKKITINRNTIRLGIQFGKIFNDVAIRCGLFEGSAGVGIDIDIPFETDKFRWITTFEMFDMTGQNRIDDRRPHLKWLNRMHILRNIYFTFGADDFISKRNASAFVGGGLRFGDDDVKYLLSSLSGIASGISS